MDDLIDSKWVNKDGTFEIAFDKERFKDSIFERNPDIYLIVRNSFGQIYTQLKLKEELMDQTLKIFFLTLT